MNDVINKDTEETLEDSSKFSLHQKKILGLCLAAYACAYLTRVNLSVAMPAISESLGLTSSQTGTIASAFLWFYAIGQLISGRLGDKIPTKYMVLTGLSVSFLCNIAVAFSTDYILMSVFWGINGLFQSMLWAPIVYSLSLNFSGKKLFLSSFYMSLSLVLGYTFSWSGSSLLKMFFSWQYIFIIPALISIIFCIVWVIFYNEKREARAAVKKDKNNPQHVSLFKNKSVLVIIILSVLGAMTHGVVKESINIWLPTIIESVGIFSEKSVIGILFLVIIINFFGVLLSRFIMKKQNRGTGKTICIILLASLITSFLLVISTLISPHIFTALTIILFGLMFALNPLFTAFLPFHFKKYNIVSTMAGLLDFSIYFGAAFSSIATGWLYEENGSWVGVTIMWLMAMLLGFVIMFAANSKMKKDKNLDM